MKEQLLEQLALLHSSIARTERTLKADLGIVEESLKGDGRIAADVAKNRARRTAKELEGLAAWAKQIVAYTEE